MVLIDPESEETPEDEEDDPESANGADYDECIEICRDFLEDVYENS